MAKPAERVINAKKEGLWNKKSLVYPIF